MSEDGTKKNGFNISPWEREEKEKREREAVLESRRARDREIALLEGVSGRSEQQEEWLRILRLEREFQRRADQHHPGSDDDSDSDTQEAGEDEKLTVIPHEKLGLELLDNLFEHSSKNQELTQKASNSRDAERKSPSEKHFIPLDVTIPENDLQPPSLPLTNNILKISLEQDYELASTKSCKAPVPTPRSSKFPFDLPKQERGLLENDKSIPESSLANLEISDSSLFFYSNEEIYPNCQETTQNLLLDRNVGSSSKVRDPKCLYHQDKREQNSDSRIYENIKPADYQFLKTQSSSYGWHTLPKSYTPGATSSALTTGGQSVSDEQRAPNREKKFPSMGVSSTLTKKSNGYTASDIDILPSLYASSVQTRNAKEDPSDLADKSPEFRKMWLSRPEKLTFQDKIRKFSIQAGEEDTPRDRVKNSRAQRELEIKFSDSRRREYCTQKSAEA